MIVRIKITNGHEYQYACEDFRKDDNGIHIINPNYTNRRETIFFPYNNVERVIKES